MKLGIIKYSGSSLLNILMMDYYMDLYLLLFKEFPEN